MAMELDTVVIGSGPGGYVAAIRAAQLGQKVAIVEREFIGGVCLNVGCIPSKALITAGHHYHNSKNDGLYGVSNNEVTIDFKATQEWKQNSVVNRLTSGVEMLLKKNKVEIIRGEANFTNTNTIRVSTEDSGQTYKFNNAIIATGSRPIELPAFKYSKRIIDSTGALGLQEIPKSMVLIGGGYIGSELAGVYANLGTEITILEGTNTILGGFDKDMVKLVEKDFKDKNVNIITNAMAKSADETDKDVTVTYEVDGKPETVTAEYCLVVVGRKPNTDNLGLKIAGVETSDRGLIKVDAQGRSSNKNIFAIGDVVPGPALAHKASYEGKTAAAAISGSKDENDYVAMPAVAFSSPELGTVGLNEAQAKEQGIAVKVAKFPFAGNGRALSMDAADGFVRIVTEKESGLVLGAQVAGANASELIAELTLAVEGRMNIEDIALTIHTHPTLSEMTNDTAEAILGMPIHM